VQLRDDRGALSDRSAHPLHRAATDIADSEDSFDTGLQLSDLRKTTGK